MRDGTVTVRVWYFGREERAPQRAVARGQMTCHPYHHRASVKAFFLGPAVPDYHLSKKKQMAIVPRTRPSHGYSYNVKQADSGRP